MDLSDGRYLGHEILAVSDDWLVVWDGKYNYYLFNSSPKGVLDRYKRKRMPRNNVSSGEKQTEFYTVFDNAVRNLCKVVANDGFFTFTKVLR